MTTTSDTTPIVWRVIRRYRNTKRHATIHGRTLCHALPAGNQFDPDDPSHPTCPKCAARALASSPTTNGGEHPCPTPPLTSPAPAPSASPSASPPPY